MSNQSNHHWRAKRSPEYKILNAPPPPEGVDEREFSAIIREVPAMGDHNMRRLCDD